MSSVDREGVELFLQEASEHLQYLREYVSVLQEVDPRHEDLERLYIAAHTLSGTSASYGFPRFSEIAGKLAHVFQYSLNAPLGSDLHGPLTEFLSDGISLLENDLLEISDTAKENCEDIAAFKERYRFAFPTEPPPSLWAVARGQLSNPMNIMLLIVVAASFAIVQIATALVVLGLVLGPLITWLGSRQEQRIWASLKQHLEQA